MEQYALEMRNITKQFPGVKALDDVNFKGKTLSDSRISWRKRCGEIDINECFEWSISSWYI